MDLTGQPQRAKPSKTLRLAALLDDTLNGRDTITSDVTITLRDHLRDLHDAGVKPPPAPQHLFSCRLDALGGKAPADVHVLARDNRHAVERVVEAAAGWAVRRVQAGLPVPGVDPADEPVTPQQELQIGGLLSRVQIEARTKVKRADTGLCVSVRT